MAERSGATLVRRHRRACPLYAGALAAAEAGVRTGGDPRNRAHLDRHVVVDARRAALEALAFDPQTSGGLLAALPPAAARDTRLADAGFVPIGEVIDGPASVHLG